MRIGAPVFVEAKDPFELARAHAERGYRASFCRISPNASPDQVEAYRKAFAEHDVVIAEANAMCISLLNTNEESRRKSLEQITEKLAFADKVGARCCAIHGGTVQAEGWGDFNPENFSQESFDKMVSSIQTIIDAVRPKTTKLAIEIEPYTLPDSPQVYRDLIDAVDRPGFGVHFDPVNSIISPRTLARSGEWLREYLDKVGPWIVTCHAKDIVFTRDGEVRSRYGYKEVPPGQGFLDYEVFIKGVAELPQDPPIMIEHLKTEEEYAAAREYIAGVAGHLGVPVVE